jgi:hypothetical protein
MKFALALAILLANPAATASEPMVLPITGLTASDLINQYQSPLTEYGAGHRGIDLPATMGSEVISPVSGEISFSGQVGYRDSISIKFSGTMWASLEPVCSDMAEGTLVSAGEPIGTVCQTNPNYQWHCEITCIHFGTRTEDGYFSPLALIGGLPVSRLVPLGDQALG